MKLREEANDRPTWKLWCLWCATIYGVPLISEPILLGDPVLNQAVDKMLKSPWNIARERLVEDSGESISWLSQS